ncbi:hypothetical protein I4U23_019717 [Adineta vaga]|nr:hypothetical protein I4U23_019717 [Adineta vaga]
MNRRTIVPPEEMNQHHYAGTIPVQPFSYASQQPTPPRKSIQHDTDVITQTRSFQMLEGWIEDSEKLASSNLPITNKSTDTSPVVHQQNYSSRRFSAGGATSHPSRSFRYLQEQYGNETSPIGTKNTVGLRRSSDIPTPYRTIKQDTSEQSLVNRSESVNNREDLTEIYNKLPPSFRAREPEAKRFTGSSNPSRAFRFLQKMTEDDHRNDPTPVAGYIKPHQLINKTNQSKSPDVSESDF